MRILIFIAIITLWEGIVVLFGVSERIFPAPSSVWTILLANLTNGTFLNHFYITFIQSLIGFIIGSLAGVILAVFVSEFSLIRKLIYPYILGLQAVPIVALAPLFIIWFGFGMSSKIALTVTIVFFPVLINTVTGLENTNQSQVKLLKVYSASAWQIFRRVKLPNALPYIFAGLEIAIVLSVVGAVISEFVGSEAGLGYLIIIYNNQLNMAAQFAVLIVLGVLGILLSFMIKWLSKKMIFWQQPIQNTKGL
ncbi:hypothetical protein LQ50_24185 [Halalkalibacter okhensis]|uniref:ABC transmembrane type-1 domain-containing protein n=1 Tax=Halalkalibacter okhensis TaxID=333138 RepID=A0A0B0I9N7_9BACI|nr:hypothetical protein LQ50_24185 [Halalkalibacter okhensis]